MRILKQLTRKKNAFFRGIKFNLMAICILGLEFIHSNP